MAAAVSSSSITAATSQMSQREKMCRQFLPLTVIQELIKILGPMATWDIRKLPDTRLSPPSSIYLMKAEPDKKARASGKTGEVFMSVGVIRTISAKLNTLFRNVPYARSLPCTYRFEKPSDDAKGCVAALQSYIAVIAQHEKVERLVEAGQRAIKTEATATTASNKKAPAKVYVPSEADRTEFQTLFDLVR